MTSVDDALAALSPEQRAAFELLLRRRRAADPVDPALAPAAGLAPISPRADRESFPLSFSQQRLWFLDQLSPGDPAYNIHGALRLRGRLDSTSLARSLREIATRHEALRSRFPEVEGRAGQTIAPAGGPPLPRVDLAALPEERREAEVLRLAVEEARLPFDLARGALLRVTLLCTAAGEAVLLLTMHHIVSDGWSIGVLLRELPAFYAGERLPPLRLQYADFAAWQRQHLAGERLERETAHWRSRLAGAPELRLPADGKGAARGGSVPLAVPARLAERLKELGRSAGASLFMTLCAVLEVLLQRWTGQSDFALGTPVANRNRPEIEGLIGFFVNTLVLRADLAGDPPFRALLGVVRRTVLDALSHQELPFEKLVAELQPERRLGRNPLFSAFLVLQNAPAAAPGIPGLELSTVPVRNGAARFDLALDLVETAEGGIAGFLDHGPAALSPVSAQRMAGHFLALLEAVVDASSRPLSALAFLSAAECHQVLREWAEPWVAAAADGPGIVERIAAQAWRTPDAVAVAQGARELTYRELDDGAARLARDLRARGVGPEVTVAIQLRKSPEAILAMLAVLRAGGAYLPLDPAYPAERLAWLRADARAPVTLGEELLIPAEEKGKGGLVDVPSGSAAYILYTSGSTGRPKGVIVTRANLLASTLARLHGYAPPVSSFLILPSLAFDSSVAGIFWTLCQGGELVLPEEGGAADPARLCQLIAERRVSHWLSIPSLYALLLEASEPGQHRLLSSLTAVVVAGEACPADLPARHAAALPGVPLLNEYGPTEGTVWVTAGELAGRISQRISIGRPIAGARVLLLDRDLWLVPAGVPGELVLGGAGLARGYFGRPDLTAERFVPDPLTAVPGARLYRTGDLGRWLPDGRLELLGRLDDQVKIRGIRVEPAEIEAALTAHPAVRAAVVLPRAGTDGEVRLVAWAVPVEGAAIPPAGELRAFLNARLPAALVPSRLIPLAAFPLGPHGKLDRSALPEPEGEGTGEGAAAPASDPAQELMAALFAELLGRTRVGLDESFFDLGGHSLLATRLVSRVRAAFGVELPVRRLFQQPTVAGLLEAVREAEGGPAPPPLRRSVQTGPPPLSFAQRRLWIDHQLVPGSTVYNLPAGFRLRGALDVDALRWSLGEIIRRQESLRTSFPVRDGEPAAVVAPAAEFVLPLVDLAGLSAEAREGQALRLARADGRRPFDLERGPLVRISLLRLGAADWELLLNVHHIVSDGWSASVFLRELTALYAAFHNGESSPLPELPIQYSDFARWQAGWLRGEALESHAAWWRQQLAGSPESLDLPGLLDPNRRPADPASPAAWRAESVPLHLAAEPAAGLRALGSQADATLYMTLLAALLGLLGRYSGQESVRVGSPVAGRGRLETEGLIGFFIGTLVIQADLAGDPSFRELLGRVREAVLGAWTHQDLPFEKLVEELGQARGPGLSPLFQVLFALQNLPREELRLANVDVSRLAADPGTTPVDLAFSLIESEGEVAGAIRYKAGLFSAAGMQRLAGHYSALLEAAAADPLRPLSDLPFLSAAERHQILVEWAGPERALPEGSFGELFDAAAACRPDQIAVVLEGESLTYAALHRRSAQLARHLLRGGAGPETVVAISVERSLEMVVGLLGILKAGAAYLPIDPRNPQERQSFLLEDCGAALLLTQERWAASFRRPGLRVLCLDADWESVANESAPSLPSRATPGNAVALLYTSGSTGRPKATVVEGRGFLNLCHWFREAAPVSASTTALLGLAFSFDAAFKNIIVPLLAGGRLVLANPGPFDAVEMWSAIRDEKVTVLITTPSQIYPVLNVASADGYRSLESVESLILGGEAAAWSELRPWLAGGNSRSALSNMYGPAECSDTITGYRLAPDEISRLPAGGGRLPVGRPGSNMRPVVVDRGFQPLPVGIAGELCVWGACVARGYFARPELTAERFVPAPFAEHGGERMYRTGDLVRWLPDGNLELLGRLDRQIKIRGVRVEPEEVEAVLLEHPAVRGASVVALAGDTAGARLAACVVLRETEGPLSAAATAGAAETVAALRSYLRGRLPAALVPSSFTLLPALPFTPRGKVDRQAVRELVSSAARVETAETGELAHAAPRDALEERLAALWAEILGVERVGIEDDFFGLGGHSLLATRVILRVRADLGVELPVLRLFEHPTVAGLAAAIREASPAVLLSPALRRAPRGEAAPLSFAQQRLWLLHQLSPGLTAYNVPSGLRLRGRLAVAALDGALSAIVRRHEALRTRFEIRGGEAVQVVDPLEPRPLPLIDLAALPPAARSAEAGALERAEAAQPFDLGRPPLLRARLLRLAPEEHLLLLTVHHIASDAWSMGVAAGELAALYPAALAEGLPSPLPEMPFQYADFAAEQREALRGEALAGEIAFWRGRLAGAEPLDIPTDRPRRPAPRFAGSVYHSRLPQGAAARVRQLAREGRATPFIALLAPLLALLSRLAGTDDVVAGTTVTGRDRPGLDRLIGFFVNTLVLRTGLADDPDGSALLARTRQTVLEAFGHQSLPFDRLVEELALPRDPYRPPLLRVLIQDLDLPAPALELPGLTVESFERSHDAAKLDLVINLRETPEGLQTSWVYDTDLFEPVTIARFAESFAILFAAWAEQPEIRLSDLPLLSAAARHQALVEWNAAPPLQVTPRRCLHQRFEEQADLNPETVAVAGGTSVLTYRAVEERANRLAHFLIARGVRPGDRVALCLERSPEMVVALLAVLKAGAAYVPLDPADPEERRAHILADSGARLLLDGESLRLGGPETRPGIKTDSALPAYVIYTSGSTGRPKGVVVSHANVDRLLAATEPRFGFGPDDVWTLFHSYAFDFSVWEIWGALAYGGRLAVVPYRVSRSPGDFLRLLAREGVTVLNQTPSAFRQLLWAEAAAPVSGSLRLVIFGGEALDPAVLHPWVRRHGLDRPALVNMYGITETTVHVTARRLAAMDLAGESRIGPPLPDLSLHVLDRRLEPQPIGVPGEICVGGAGLAQGYLGRPDLTAERFVPDPFADQSGVRLYRSGDLARRLADGGVEYLGRIDHQVKIRGFRIELGEIEAALAGHPGVREAVVVVREDGRGEARRLVAYVVPGPDGEAGVAELREHLASCLPAAMLPSAVVVLAALPLTVNGKVDRRALPAPGAAVARASTPPRTPLEQFLAGLFRQVLGEDREIGVEDDFFALGGSSITGAILVNRLQETLGEIVHVVVIFDHPTVASLAAYVTAQHPRPAQRFWGEGGEEERAVEEKDEPVGEAEIIMLRRLVAAGSCRGAAAADPSPRNPPALFVLAPPRSGTTLLRVMLGAHPALFAPPELELLSFRTMAERQEAFQGRDSFWLEGVIRAVMEARGCAAADAERIIAETEREGWSTRRFYGALQEWIGGRMLVDKTPSYALDPEVLRQAEEDFTAARYLHLVRHPQAAIRSFEEARLDQIFFRRPHSFNRRRLAELIWTVSHENILDFLAGVPAERRRTVVFEELVREPGRVLAGICTWLGLEFQPEMAEPYQPGVARMTDGPQAVSRMLGDVKFLAHGKVDAQVAERWRGARTVPLGEPAVRLAKALGYEDLGRAAPGRGVLVPLQAGPGEKAGRPLFCVHPVGGDVTAYVELARRLGPGQPFYGLQTPEPPLVDLPEMAALYLESVRQIQTAGPYRLAGWSLGGILAYEMVCQAAERGEKVELLALIDVAAPAQLQPEAGSAEPDDAELALHFAGDQAGLFGISAPAESFSGLSVEGILARVLEIGREAGVLAPGIEPRDIRRLFERFRVNRRALLSYRPRPYPGDAVLFRAGERVARMQTGDDPTLGWGELITGGLRICDLPGDHYSILRGESAQRLAERLVG